MNANKNFNKEASPQSKTKKLKKKLGPQWTKDELERFYEAYQKHGRDWKKVAASVENNRSVDMVEALFSMNQPYLSLPEASVDGLAAIMTAHYSLFEESESKGKGHDASGVTRGFPIKKLHDAEDLEKQCTLILTEGDSAKHLVMAGLSSLQRKTYGVYPLQGKLLNVRIASQKSIKKNRELQNIKTIIGLKDETSYTTTDSLRYKHVMIMTDQDEDGVHIKGLLINFFYHNWPQLLELNPPFLSEFRTPIVKVKNRNEVEAKSFYSMAEYSEWKEQQADNLSKWETTHYKVCIKYADALTGSLNDEDMKNTEPMRYYPIVPMVLVNGCRGIGSGWSTFIPNYKLKDVISNVEHLLNDEKTEPMDPWYEGFEGTITKDGENRYKTFGRLEESSGNAETRLVTELPIEVWTNNYVSSLEKENRGKVSAFIENYLDRSNDTTVSIQIELKKTEKKMTPEEEKEILGLTTILSTSNMYLFDEYDMIKKYESPQEIIEDFYEARLKAYDKRKELMLMELHAEFDRLECIVAFVTDVMKVEFRFDREWSCAQLKGKYEAIGRDLTDYSFLLDLPISSFSQKSLGDLQEARDKVKHEITEVETLTSVDVWKSEFKKLRASPMQH
ncbi:hypothetical protein IGI04_009137 [Brassica rapa subsp. trilocularis]|uniref:DNA topoisomerase (ATP-hydrolyzing) n=1 Tax=Brassica rapa subsp. trilocularis TaxID=1813537 RepID=A0ABQ7MXJ7_BRACM|nr:hypothetical protein IGI04_009137 [Brassica rapa subsp. trilocularis]